MVNSFDSWETELYHHGIKGQKWGVRRYQNEDGTLTPEGLKRYGVNEDGSFSKKAQKKLYNDLRKYERRDYRHATDFFDMKVMGKHNFKNKKELDMYLSKQEQKVDRQEKKIRSIVTKLVEDEVRKHPNEPFTNLYKTSGDTQLFINITNKLLGEYGDRIIENRSGGTVPRARDWIRKFSDIH